MEGEYPSTRLEKLNTDNLPSILLSRGQDASLLRTASEKMFQSRVCSKFTNMLSHIQVTEIRSDDLE